MTTLEKARAMMCFGKVVERVELDPDPSTRKRLTEEFNCGNCDSYKYCSLLANTLKS